MTLHGPGRGGGPVAFPLAGADPDGTALAIQTRRWSWQELVRACRQKELSGKSF
jgi:hypothetical protein